MVELVKDYNVEIHYHPGKANVGDEDTPRMSGSVSDLSRYLQIVSPNISFNPVHSRKTKE